MSRQYWQELLSWATSDGAAVVNTTTETIIYPNITIPANYLQDGRVLRVRAFGKLSTTGTPTMRWRTRFGGVSGTVMCDSGAITMPSAAANNIWSLEVIIQVRTNGSTGTVMALGEIGVGGVNTFNPMGSAGATNPAAVTFDLTADFALSLTAQWGTASTSNTLTGLVYVVESLN